MKSRDVIYLIHLINQQRELPDEIKQLKKELQEIYRNAQAKRMWRVPVTAELTVELERRRGGNHEEMEQRLQFDLLAIYNPLHIPDA